MNFNNLDEHKKKALVAKINEYAVNMGGINPFLQMLESLRNAKPNGLLNKTATCHFGTGTVSWGKSIYRDTFTILFNSIKKEEQDGDMLNGLNPKDYKNTMNMMRTLKPLELTVNIKDNADASFSFNILDSSEAKNTKIDFMFKVIFFYSIDTVKKILAYKEN
jgi:hypothetical protein